MTSLNRLKGNEKKNSLIYLFKTRAFFLLWGLIKPMFCLLPVHSYGARLDFHPVQRHLFFWLLALSLSLFPFRPVLLWRSSPSPVEFIFKKTRTQKGEIEMGHPSEFFASPLATRFKRARIWSLFHLRRPSSALFMKALKTKELRK